MDAAQCIAELQRQVSTARRATQRHDERTVAYTHHVINAILDGMGL